MFTHVNKSMGLFDIFNRPPPAPTVDEARRMGRLEAEVERLGLEWLAYRDELKRLVSRLEKRDQRALERETREEVANGSSSPDPTTERVLARRRGVS